MMRTLSAPGSAGRSNTAERTSTTEHSEHLPAFEPPPEPGADPRDFYDVVIAGAGPAGSVSAALLAARGWRVLLVEKQNWPRDKACGGCLNAAAVRMLHAIGLGAVLENTAPLEKMSLRMNRRELHLPLPAGAAVVRSDLDDRLVSAAIARGTTFLPNTAATLLSQESHSAIPFRTLRLTDATNQTTRLIQSRIVLACDGLRGGLLANEPWAHFDAAPGIRLGFATTVPAVASFPEKTLAMFISPAGYVGLVRLANDSLHLGASLRPDLCNAAHGPFAVIQSILASCHFPLDIPAATFIGTGPLTGRRAAVAGHRVMAIGDACGYVEPFTGEGISWAIRGAIAAANLLPDNPTIWPETLAADWQKNYDREIAHRQRWCRRLRTILHRPRLASACMTLAQTLPVIPRFLAHRISA